MKAKQLHIPLFLAVATLFLSSCARMYLESGKSAYEDYHYQEAIKDLKKGLERKGDSEGKLALANAYYKTNEFEQASETYSLINSDPIFDDQSRVFYAQSLMATGKHDQAKTILDGILSRDPGNEWAQQLKLSIVRKNEFVRDSSSYKVERVTIEGMETAMGPVPYGDGYMISAQTAPKGERDPYINREFFDLYRTNESMSAPVPMSGLNTPYHDGMAAFSPDEQTVYFTRSHIDKKKRLEGNAVDESTPQIYMAEMVDGAFSGDTIVSFSKTDATYAHPTLSKNGRTMYFASDRQGGMGGMDLWMVEMKGEEWGEPENLGSRINTPGNEAFPTLKSDDSLYYSTDGMMSLGGLELVYTTQGADGWRNPTHLSYPINSNRDDFGITFDKSGETGYFTSDRSGLDQIYSFIYFQPELVVEGTLIDKNTMQPVAGQEVIIKNLTDGTEEMLITDANGRFSADLLPNKEYEIVSSQDPYLSNSQRISTMGKTQDETFTLVYELDPLVVDQPYDIPDIYWGFDKWNVRTESEEYLNEVAQILKDNANLRVEIASHCDSRGSDSYNIWLSNKRAEAAVRYLVKKGIDRSRMTSQGYGETRLLNNCGNGVRCSEEEHQENRRTEFTIKDLDGKVIEVFE